MDHCAEKIKALFSNRRLVIATKHEKEKAIAPLMETTLGVSCFVPENFDTDVFGTFTGETPRKEDPLTTLRNKCQMAMSLTNCDLAIASEGSFGMHPAIFFVHADDEMLMLVDKKNDLEIAVRELSVETNYDGSEVTSEEGLVKFANKAGFPTHGLVLRVQKDNPEDLHKGITDWDDLKRIYRQLITKHAQAYVETDMRAMYNPTRMGVIEIAAKKLVEKINTCCPQCGAPGFAVTGTRPGLPCSFCGLPTKLALAHIWSCNKCGFTREESATANNQQADPQYCDRCNP